MVKETPVCKIIVMDEMTWTIPTAGGCRLLRSKSRQPTNGEKMQIAAMLDSFMALLGKTQKRRNEVVKRIKEAVTNA